MSQRDPGEYMRNMALAASAGQAGCTTSVLIIGALLLGLWLDSLLGTRPAFTLVLVLSSIPVSLLLMVYTVLSATKRITPPKRTSSRRDVSEED